MLSSKLIRITILYAVILHLVVGALIYETRLNEPKDKWALRLHSFYLRVDANLPADAVVFIGDSHTQGLCTSCITPLQSNYGIGKDTLANIRDRLKDYRSLKSARALVIQAGHNDLKTQSDEQILDQFSKLLSEVPASLELFVTNQFPVGAQVEHAIEINERKQNINHGMQQLCISNPRCTMLDLNRALSDSAGFLALENQLPDGVHLNKKGYVIWIQQLSLALSQLNYATSTDNTI